MTAPCGPRKAAPVRARRGRSELPTAAAQSCASAFSAGGVPCSVKISERPAKRASSARLKVRWS